MTDYDLILHERIRQNGIENIVKRLMASEAYEMEKVADCEAWSMVLPTDSEIRFEASRCAYRLRERNCGGVV